MIYNVKCATCGEPWDTHHLRHDEVHETPAGQDWISFQLADEDWDRKMCGFGGLSREAALRACGPGPQPPPHDKWEGKITPFWREQFRPRGWEFGTSVVAVLRCPYCTTEGALENARERRNNVQLLSELLEDDEDAQESDNELALWSAEDGLKDER